jgi:sugar diacid utilization regulator
LTNVDILKDLSKKYPYEPTKKDIEWTMNLINNEMITDPFKNITSWYTIEISKSKGIVTVIEINMVREDALEQLSAALEVYKQCGLVAVKKEPVILNMNKESRNVGNDVIIDQNMEIPTNTHNTMKGKFQIVK